jgi:hypothetical protein
MSSRLLLLLLFAATSTAVAQWPCERPEAKKNDAFYYVTSFIAANAKIQSACELAFQNGEQRYEGTDLVGHLTQAMYHLKQANDELGCAKRILEPYLTSPKDLIKLPAFAATKAVNTLMDAGDKEIAFVKKVLTAQDQIDSGTKPTISSATMAEKTADIGVQEDAAWKLLANATQGAFYSLVDQDRMSAAQKSGNPDGQDRQRFSITAKQRWLLLSTLETTFGPSVKKGVKQDQANRTSVLLGADFLYQAISNPTWKAKDEPTATP